MKKKHAQMIEINTRRLCIKINSHQHSTNVLLLLLVIGDVPSYDCLSALLRLHDALSRASIHPGRSRRGVALQHREEGEKERRRRTSSRSEHS